MGQSGDLGRGVNPVYHLLIAGTRHRFDPVTLQPLQAIKKGDMAADLLRPYATRDLRWVERPTAVTASCKMQT